MGGVDARGIDEEFIVFLKGVVFGVCLIIEPALVEYRTNPLQNQ
jgi:hypothetical protein